SDASPLMNTRRKETPYSTMKKEIVSMAPKMTTRKGIIRIEAVPQAAQTTRRPLPVHRSPRPPQMRQHSSATRMSLQPNQWKPRSSSNHNPYYHIRNSISTSNNHQSQSPQSQ